MDFDKLFEELYLRLANADTDDLVELAKLTGLEHETVIEEKQMSLIETVQVPGVTFATGKYPVTQEQYQSVMGTNPSHFQGNPQNPVESVSYDDAQAFCQKLSQMTGKNYRLPTEAEWEYACRAGTDTAYCFGDDINQLEDYAWYDDNSQETTHPVGLKLPNAWGIYDMHGNVLEWCQEGCMRGGSWSKVLCRSAIRYHIATKQCRYYDSGFRVVCDN